MIKKKMENRRLPRDQSTTGGVQEDRYHSAAVARTTGRRAFSINSSRGDTGRQEEFNHYRRLDIR